MRKLIRIFLSVFCLGLLCGVASYTIVRDANSFMGIQRRNEVESAEPVSDGYLQINGVRAPYDSKSDVWYVPQAPDSEDWVGELSWSNGAEVFFCEDEMLQNKADSLADGHIFTLQIEGHGTANVVFTGMPAVAMHTEGSKPVEGEKYAELFNGRFSFFDPTGQSGSGSDNANVIQYAVIGADATWHARGSTSMYFPKTSWRIELHDDEGENLNVPLLDLRDDDDWILLSLYNDDSKIRDKMSLDLWNAIASGTDYNCEGTHMRYVEVFVDDEYQGLYGLLEPIDQKTVGLNQETDYLYKTIDWYCPTNSEMFAIRSATSRSFTLKWPKEYNNGAQWQPMRDYISIYYNDVNSTNVLIQEKRLNLPNAIDYALFVNATTAIDNTFKNAYIWAKSENMGAMSMYVFNKIPWDLNYTWGEAWIDGPNYTYFNPDLYNANMMPGDVNSLIYRDYETLAPMIKERWTELRETVMSDEALLGHMEELRAYLDSTGAFTRDTERWPSSGNDPDLTEMKEFFEKRYTYLDEFYEKL